MRDARVDKVLLDEYAPPAVAVDGQMAVVYAVGETGKYLSLPEGRFDGQITGMTPTWMRADVVAAIHASRRDNERVERVVVPPRKSDGDRPTAMKLIVRPIEGDLTLIAFDEVADALDTRRRRGRCGDGGARRWATPTPRSAASCWPPAKTSTTRSSSSSSRNEELKASNEELLSMNEELQSANEELQTSKEEYQSTNEELETVNAEVRRKVEELNDANADLQNLFGSGQVPTVFLDRGLNIKRFTPGAEGSLSAQRRRHRPTHRRRQDALHRRRPR